MTVLQQTNSKSWGTCDLDLNDREFKISVMKKLGETQENSERQFDELRNTINEQEYFAKEIETIKHQILELQSSINEMENALEREQIGRESMN